MQQILVVEDEPDTVSLIDRVCWVMMTWNWICRQSDDTCASCLTAESKNRLACCWQVVPRVIFLQ